MFRVDDGKPVWTGDILDRATLASLLEVVPDNFKFDLVDFKITPDGTIYVLD